MSAPQSLCFHKASQKFKDGDIGEEKYYRNILAHCTGYLHDEDDDDPSLSGPSTLQSDDAFAYAVQCFMKRKDFIKDITPLSDAFQVLSNQDVSTIQEAVAKLDDQPQAKNFLPKILALRSLQLRKAGVLKYCLEVGGFPYEAYFEDEADGVREEEDPLTFHVLEESHFRKVYPRTLKVTVGDEDDDISDSNLGAAERERSEKEKIAATFDKGGEFPVEW